AGSLFGRGTRAGAEASLPLPLRGCRQDCLTFDALRRGHLLHTLPLTMLNDETRAQAVECLSRGGLVAVPTETVYGLAADASNELAVRRIFAAKGRPSSHPLIVHVAGVDSLEGWVREVP